MSYSKVILGREGEKTETWSEKTDLCHSPELEKKDLEEISQGPHKICSLRKRHVEYQGQHSFVFCRLDGWKLRKGNMEASNCAVKLKGKKT